MYKQMNLIMIIIILHPHVTTEQAPRALPSSSTNDPTTLRSKLLVHPHAHRSTIPRHHGASSSCTPKLIDQRSHDTTEQAPRAPPCSSFNDPTSPRSKLLVHPRTHHRMTTPRAWSNLSKAETCRRVLVVLGRYRACSSQ